MFILNSLGRKMLKIRQRKKRKNTANVNDAINAKHNDFRKLQKQHDDSQNQLRQPRTWLKCIAFYFR